MKAIKNIFLSLTGQKEIRCVRCSGRGTNSRGDWCWECSGTGRTVVKLFNSFPRV